MSQSLFSDLSDSIYNIKEKITDNEFIELMNQLNSFKKEQDSKEKDNSVYKFTILYPCINVETESCHCHPYKFHSQSHSINIKKLSFNSKMVSCKNSKMNEDDYCSCCSRNSDHCIRVNSIKNALKNNNYFSRNINFDSLVKIVDENCKEILNELKLNLNRSSLVESIEVIENENDEEDEEEENETNKNKIKQIVRNRINFDIQIYLESVEKISE
jgi:hypothetical protein